MDKPNCWAIRYAKLHMSSSKDAVYPGLTTVALIVYPDWHDL